MDYYIAHHGVKGQKWGRRRYQNEDGSYKPGAEGRYYDESPKAARRQAREEKRQNRLDKKIARVQNLRKVNKDITDYKNKNIDIDSPKKVVTVGDVGKREKAKKDKATNNAALKYTEVNNRYREARLKAKKNPAYKESKEYRAARREHGQQVTDSIIYGARGTQRIYRDKAMGKSDKQARRRELGRQVAAGLVVAAASIGYAYYTTKNG